MKKLITYTSICLIAILLMPSCSSKMGLMKRHYSKGYYVSHSGSKNKTPIAKEESKRVDTEKIEIIQVVSAQPKEKTFENQVKPKPTESIMASAIPTKKGYVNMERKTNYKSITVTKPATEVRKMITQLGTASSDRDGLSLFWLVILVILILWLFGFLAGGFGLGGLINILLVIALILLILWLLRVV